MGDNSLVVLEDDQHIVADMQKRIEDLCALLRRHDCNAHSWLKVGECIGKGWCDCSAARLLNISGAA